MINLPTNFRLIAKFLAGSHIYGTNTPESDRDIRGVFIPSKEYFFGFSKRTEQYEDKKEDIVFYELRKFLYLATQNNPTILEFLFIPIGMHIYITPEWRQIQNNRDLFVSKKCKFTFSGYAHSQLKRIKGHRAWLLNPPKKKPEREDYGLPSDTSLVTKDQMGAFNAIIAAYLEQTASHHKLKEQLEELEETANYKAIIENTVNIPFGAVKELAPFSDNLMEAVAREKAYTNALRQWKQYQNWKKSRNPNRAKLEEQFGYDTKHAMHLYRLMEECKEVLTTGQITLPRPECGHLLAIKNGIYTFDSLIERFENLDQYLDELYESSNLQYSPDLEKIDQICIRIVEDYFFEKQLKNNILSNFK